MSAIMSARRNARLDQRVYHTKFHGKYIPCIHCIRFHARPLGFFWFPTMMATERPSLKKCIVTTRTLGEPSTINAAVALDHKQHVNESNTLKKPSLMTRASPWGNPFPPRCSVRRVALNAECPNRAHEAVANSSQAHGSRPRSVSQPPGQSPTKPVARKIFTETPLLTMFVARESPSTI